MTAEEKKSTRKKFTATNEMKKIMADYYYELDSAAKNNDKKIAWCTSVGPAEILRSLGFYVYFPENHGAMLGASRMSTDLIPYANAIGYSPEVCSYLTSDIGAYLKKVTPLSNAYEGIKNIPKPDVVVFNTNQCRDVQDWMRFYAKEFKVPLLGIHTHSGVNDVTDTHIQSIAQQMKEMIGYLEKISGKTFDAKELHNVLSLSRECSDLWKEVLDTAANIPSPLTFFDGTIQIAPAVALRGTQIAVDYYKLLLKELKERVKNHEGAVEGVYQLRDENKVIIVIKGSQNMKADLQEKLNSETKARYFWFEPDPMYTKRESELIQQFLQQFGKMPEGDGEGDDLDDLF